MRIALIIVRYGLEIVGGAETAARKLMERVAARGHCVDVLTTCLRHLQTQADSYPEGQTVINGTPVRRFPAESDATRAADAIARIEMKLEASLPLTLDEQYMMVDAGIHSPKLYSHLSADGAQYDFLVFSHYWMGLTYYGATLFPDKAIIWPHLHDFEPFAYSEPTRLLLEESRGIVLNSQWEMEFATNELGVRNPRMKVIGLGIEEEPGDPAFAERVYRVRAPFMLYSGQLEQGKNVPLLMDYFLRYKERGLSDLKLVLMGTGPEPVPGHPDLIPLGFIPEDDKRHVFAAATLLCQPSVRESFSLVIMESWLQGVPVLVHRDCGVTKHHCLASNGGLYFADYDEFEACLDLLLDSPSLRATMGQNGRRYVVSNFNWDVVADRLEEALQSWAKDR
jgi:glycosyltransferase involved in cell wall biosynthesis